MAASATRSRLHFRVDPLDHVLAPLVLEVDIDVGRLVACVGQEALEQNLVLVGIDLGDAEAVADGGIGGGAAALAKDAPSPRACSTISCTVRKYCAICLLLDQRELVPDRPGDLVGHPFRIAPGGAFPGQPLELLHRRLAAFIDGRVLVAQVLQRESAAVDDFLDALDGMRMLAEEAVHLLRRFQVPLGRGEAVEAQLLDRAAEANGGDDVLQRAAVGDVIVHVVGGDEAHLHPGGESVESGKPPRIVAAEQHGAGEVAAVAVQAGELAQPVVERRIVDVARRQDDGDQAFGILRQIVEGEIAFALCRAAIAGGQQPRQALVALDIHRIGEQGITVPRLQARADEKLDPLLLRGGMLVVVIPDRRIGAHHAGQGVAVGDADRVVAELDRRARPARPDASRRAGSCSWS